MTTHRIKRPWKIHKWLPITRAMSKMLDELYRNPELGFISHESWLGRTTIMVQYWESFEKLDNYAKSKASSHLPAWAEFNKKVGATGVSGFGMKPTCSKKENMSVFTKICRNLA